MIYQQNRQLRDEPVNILLPTIVSLYPPLYFFCINISVIQDYFWPICTVLISLTFGILFSLLLSMGIKENEKTVLVSSLWIFFVLTGFQLLDWFDSFGKLDFVRRRYQLIILTLFFAAATYFIIKTKKPLSGLILWLTRTFQILIFLCLIKLGLGVWGDFSGRSVLRNHDADIHQVSKPVADQKSPNIFYIVVDTYASANVLERDYSFSNENFLSALKALGFYIADKSHSNYSYTGISMASTLNMRYINDLLVKNTPNAPLFSSMFRNGRVQQYLMQRGYEYIERIFHLRYVSFHYFLEFMQNSVLSPLAGYIRSEFERWSVQRDLKTLPEIVLRSIKSKPSFVYIHMPGGHTPFNFTQKGGRVSLFRQLRGDAYRSDAKDLYVGQIEFYNQQILLLIKGILAAHDKKPIIIIQGDHGPDSLKGRDGEIVSKETVEERTSILNAYYTPEPLNELYPNITPVNTFCVLFRHYFQSDCSLRPDKVYYSFDWKTATPPEEVTSLLYGREEVGS